jgi:hypothetical protein
MLSATAQSSPRQLIAASQRDPGTSDRDKSRIETALQSVDERLTLLEQTFDSYRERLSPITRIAESPTPSTPPRVQEAAGPVVQYIRGQEERLVALLDRMNELYPRLDV